ncbi:serine protease [Streptomyces tropicalis]|uniref:Serine protease n=1 Tax=Streptomyces tropicalis TaxID=3034234 RepID=A0ABT6ADC7_9ACTN|nr:serine protease [Streptomyces tropicalis]MDF3302654.1 serine protease [Streptomyces tropicalis]
MAARGPLATDGSRTRAGGAADGGGDRAAADPAPDAGDRDRGAADRVLDRSLVRIRDLDGRPRGTAFAADHRGTLVTSHESVDGLSHLVLHAPGADRTRVVTADAVTALPALGLALVHTEDLGAAPLPVAVRDAAAPGTYVRIAAGCWREARVLGRTTATYTAADRVHALDGVLELAIGTAGRDALRQGGGVAGGPVLDTGTGAVVAVLGTALHDGERDTGFAVPLRPAGGAPGPLAVLLARNAATVPAYGADLNLAGVLELTAVSTGQDGPGPLAPPVSPRTTRRTPVRTTWGTGCGAAVPQAPPRPTAAAGATEPVSTAGAGESSAGSVAAAETGGPAVGPAPVPESGVPFAGPGTVPETGGPAVGPAVAPEPFGPSASADAGCAGPGGLAATPSGPAGSPGSPHPADPARPIPARPIPAHRGPAGATAAAFGGWGGEAGSEGGAGPAGGRGPGPSPVGTGGGAGETVVERANVVRELTAFADGPGPGAVLALVGAPGSGRTTELAALAARRARRAEPRPTLWLRGADLRDADGSVADAVGRALDRAARIVAASRAPLPADGAGPTPDRLAHHARAAGRPLLLLLDGPEEMPPALAHRLAEWTGATARWLHATGTRLVVACREEHWEAAGAHVPPALLHTPRREDGAGHLPPCLRLGDLTADEAREARVRHGVPDGSLAAADARHPLTLRLLGEVRAALPGLPHGVRLDRHDVLSAHLDLMCLRVAVRLAAGNGRRGTAVRLLAARVAGQVHEAARRSLGSGRGELERADFEALFPWGTAPARLGGGTGWASAVLAEGLLVPAGGGYRFAHEELADWIQGVHLDLDPALHALLHPGPASRETAPVPHHRIGPVVQALLLLARRHAPGRLSARLARLLCALDADPDSWWASRLLAGVLLRVPDASAHADVLRLLAEWIVARRLAGRSVPSALGPAFWIALPLPDADRCDLLRRLLHADGAAGPGAAPRYLDAAARLLDADPAAVQPHLIRWFDDESPLPATPDATAATAAQALLHTHRHRAVDDLAEALASCAHPRAQELLSVLAEEEPSALCRAVHRWAHDERPARRAAAAGHALRTAPHARTDQDRELLRRAALALLARPADADLHGSALAVLVGDPHTRARHLPRALRHFAAGDPHVPLAALAPALATHPDTVLAAFGGPMS